MFVILLHASLLIGHILSFVFSLHRALSYNGFCSIISCFVSFIFKYNLTLVHQVELSHQDAELRLLEVFFHKIYKVTGELLDLTL